MRRITRRNPGDRARKPQIERHSRRGRRPHRRDVRRSAYYDPVEASPQAARNGVQARLLYASLAGMATIGCALAVLFSLQAPFTLAALAIMGFCTFFAMIAMVLSARREEHVHQIASQGEPAQLDGCDGSVEHQIESPSALR